MLPTGADVALMVIFIHYAILIAIVLAMTAGTAYALIRLNSKMKEIMPLVQSKSRQLADTTDKVSNKAAAPFIWREAGQAKRRAQRDFVLASLRRKKDGS